MFCVSLRKEIFCFSVSRRGAFLCFFRHGKLMKKDKKREEVCFRVSFSRKGVFVCVFRHERRMEKDKNRKEVRLRCLFA